MITTDIKQLVANGVGAFTTLPVEVRDDDFTLHAKGRLQEVYEELIPGTYLMTVLLPGNTKISTKIRVTGDPLEDISIFTSDLIGRVRQSIANTPERTTTSDVVPNVGVNPSILQVNAIINRFARKGVQWLDTVLPARFTIDLDGLSVSKPEMTLIPFDNSGDVRVFRGNPMDSRALVSEPVADAEVQTGRLSFSPDPEFRIVQLHDPNHTPINMAVPPLTTICFDIVLRDGRRTLLPRLADPEADQILQLRSHGLLEQVAASVKDISDTKVLSLLAENYGAGVGCCYALMRSPDLSRLKGIVEATGEFQNRTDIKIMRGEVSARRGDHEVAIKSFFAAARSGLPCFTAGINTLLDRLRFYLMAEGSESDVPLTDPAELQELQSQLVPRLRKFAAFCDQSEVIVCYSGSDPASPSDEASTS